MTQSEVKNLILNVCKDYRTLSGKRVDSTMILSIARVESNFGLYTKGALDELGIMQIRPATMNDINDYSIRNYQKPLFITNNYDNVLASIIYYNDIIPRLLYHFKQADHFINRLLSYNSGIGKVVLNTAHLDYVIKIIVAYILTAFHL